MVNDREFYTISLFGFTDTCRQVRAFAFFIGKIYRTTQGGKRWQNLSQEFFCGLLRRKGLVQVARSLVEQGQITVLPRQVLGLLGNLSFQIRIKRFQTAAHLVETLADLGEFTNLVCIDLHPETAFADGFHPVAQFFQRSDNPRIMPNNHQTGSH